MKKGDLVKRKSLPHDEDYYVPEFKTAVLLSSPYAAVFSHVAEDGKVQYSHERPVVDLLVGLSVIQKCPIDFIVKVENER